MTIASGSGPEIAPKAHPTHISCQSSIFIYCLHVYLSKSRSRDLPAFQTSYSPVSVLVCRSEWSKLKAPLHSMTSALISQSYASDDFLFSSFRYPANDAEPSYFRDPSWWRRDIWLKRFAQRWRHRSLLSPKVRLQMRRVWEQWRRRQSIWWLQVARSRSQIIDVSFVFLGTLFDEIAGRRDGLVIEKVGRSSGPLPQRRVILPNSWCPFTKMGVHILLAV